MCVFIVMYASGRVVQDHHTIGPEFRQCAGRALYTLLLTTPSLQDNRPIARIKVSGIQPTRRGVPRVELTVTMSTTGELSVTAQDDMSSSKTKQSLTVETDKKGMPLILSSSFVCACVSRDMSAIKNKQSLAFSSSHGMSAGSH